MSVLKTNVMRILDKAKIPYQDYSYECAEFHNAFETINVLKLSPKQVFKTIVTTNKKNQYFVFVLPVEAELDLKKCAKLASQKSIELIEMNQLYALTGYLRGGCSPIGMKKQFPTYYDEAINDFLDVYVSAGKIGVQIKIKSSDLVKITKGISGDIICH